jgi:hypothetical protein
MKIRRDRNARHRILPMLRTCRQLTKVVVITRKIRHQSAHRLILPAFRTRRPGAKAGVMKIRGQKNPQHPKLPAFRIRRQREKFNLLKYAGMASPRIRDTRGDLVDTVPVTTNIDLERIVIASCCLLMSTFFIVVIVVGRD